MPDHRDDGGPAFPVPHSVDGNWQPSPLPEFTGMSLRDWFAGHALAGLTAAIRGPGCADWDYYSEASFKIADAMLAEREGR